VSAGKRFIGTSGWIYDHWRGVFYPEGLPTSEWLKFYTRRFDTVEVNYSFYRLPERAVFEKWRVETPDGFTFAVKASRYLTHMRKLKDPQEPLDRLISHAGGLNGKLGPILYQLPPGWKANVPRLREFVSLLPKDLRHAMEFRDPSWLTDEVFQVLEEYGIAYCIMSAPDLLRVMRVTAPFAYIRMHNGGYDSEGCYGDAELQWWAEQIRSMLEKADVYVYFNNDYKGFAVKNALDLKDVV
jgi:uncharacterized protein YecE (DUF72 family)